MKSFKKFVAEEAVDYIVIQAPEGISRLVEKAVLNEGLWVEAGVKDWMLRVDPKSPAISLQRHVHITRKKHINSNKMQASWNQDGTRHDKSTFNSTVGSQSSVQDISRKALGVGVEVVFEEMSRVDQLICESSSSLFQSTRLKANFLQVKVEAI